MSRRLAVALGADGITAVAQEDGAVGSFIPIRIPPATDDPLPVLREGFIALRDRLLGDGKDLRNATLSVAILPPLVDSKLLSLPPISLEEAERVVGRDAARHFVGVQTPVAVAIEPPRSGRKLVSPFLVSVVSRSFVDALHRAIDEAGLAVEAIVPAPSAWLEALDEVSRSADAGRGAHRHEGNSGTGGAGGARLLVACSGGTAHVLRVENNTLVGLRRVPLGAEDRSPRASVSSDIAQAAGNEPGSAWILAPARVEPIIGEALTRSGWAIEGRLGDTWSRRESPESDASAPKSAAVAAAWADRVASRLVPPRMEMERRNRAQRSALRMAAAAAILILAAGGIHLLGLNRQLARVQRERAEIRPAVAPLLAAADSLNEMDARLKAIEALERHAGGWTLALSELSMILPEDTHLVGFQAAGDTVVIDAIGTRAGDLLDALVKTSSFRDVRLEGPIQRDLERGATARERFTLSAVRTPSSSGVDEGSGDEKSEHPLEDPT